MRYKFFPLLFVILVVPLGAHADVLINEIAWMGSASNANAEWIELFNSGNTTVDLSGWTLSATDGVPSISLSGNISAGGFFLLERTSDATVPNVTADLIYSGALGNTGEILSLTDAHGTLMDYVEGSDSWKIGGGDVKGNNTTKETAQRTASGWATAVGTPRVANLNNTSGSSGVPSSDSEEDVPAQASIATTSIPVSSGSTFVPPRITVDAGKSRVVSAGADTAYSATVYDKEGNHNDGALVEWTFGDGVLSTGRSVMHTYYAPGEYLVTVHAESYGASQDTSFTVTAVQSGIAIVSDTETGITLENRDTRPADLSRWRLQEGSGEFLIPPRTSILPKRTVTFDRRVIKLPYANTVVLTYPNGDVADTWPISQMKPTPTVFIEKKSPPEIPEVTQTSASRGMRVDATRVSAEASVASALQHSSSTPSTTSSLITSPWSWSFAGFIAVSTAVLVLL